MRPALHIGILGAAPIAVNAVLRPSRSQPDVAIVAVAARDRERAQRFARRWQIPHVHASYDALLDDPAIDAIYVPLPNSLHATWTIRALDAGKHVLCEKPLTANAHEAAAVARAADRSGCVLMEAFHYRYHPLAARIQAIVASGELGPIRHLEAEFSVPLLRPRSIQYRYQLGGGATMDVGCYAINLVRWLAGAEPDVVSAQARLLGPQVDRLMRADLRFPDGRSATIHCALLSARLLRLSATVQGQRGRLQVIFPFLPHHFHRLRIQRDGATRHEQVSGATTYWYQLQAFVRAVRDGVPVPTDAHDAVRNMRVIDAIYAAAGLQLRGTTEQA